MTEINFRFKSETDTTVTYEWDPPADQERVVVRRGDGVETAFLSKTKREHEFKKKVTGLYGARVQGDIAEGFASYPPDTDPGPEPSRLQVGSCGHSDPNPWPSGPYVANPWSIDTLKRVGAKLVRVEFEIGSSIDKIRRGIEPWQQAGILVQPLAGFHGRVPTEAECDNLRNWALTFGPKGSGAIKNIEFGNETAYSHQWSGSRPAYVAPDYARRALRTLNVLKDTGVELMLQADGGLHGRWLEDMLATVPELVEHPGVSYWVFHTYGLDGSSKNGPEKLRRGQAILEAAGDHSTPFSFTEFGVPTWDGKTMNDSYGYAPAITYAEAGDIFLGTVDQSLTGRPKRTTDQDPSGGNTFRKPRDYDWVNTCPRMKQITVYQEIDRWTGNDSDVEKHFGYVLIPPNWGPVAGANKGVYFDAVKKLVTKYA